MSVDTAIQKINGELTTLERENLLLLLIDEINYLISHDFNKLVQLLYRIDVSESKLTNLLQEGNSNNASEIIANLIIDRQLEKCRMRNHFKSNDDIPEEDRW